MATASIALIASALAALHLPPVQRRVLDVVEGAVSDSIHGALHIGDPAGGLLVGTFEVGPSRLDDAEGRALVEVESVEVDFAVFRSIFACALIAESVRIRSPRVWMEVDAEGNSFSRLAKGPPTPPSGGPSFGPLSIVVDRATIEGGAYALDNEGGSLEWNDVDATFEGRLDPERIFAAVEEIAASSPLFADRTRVRGQVTIDPDRLFGRAFVFDDAGTTVDLTSANLVYEGVAIDARFDAHVAPPTVAHYADAVDVAADLRGTFAHAPAGAWEIDAEGRVHDAPIDIEATAEDDFGALLADVTAGPGLDLARLHPNLPRTQLDVDVQADLSDFDALTGEAHVKLSGRVDAPGEQPSLDVRALVADVTADAGALRATAKLDANGADLDANATGRLDAEGFRLDRARATFSVDRLAALLGRLAPVDGRVRGTATLDGPIDRPALSARVDARHLAFGDARVGRLDAEVDLRGEIDDPVGDARVRARGVSVSDALLGRVDLRVEREAGQPFDVRVTSRRGRGLLERTDARFAVALAGADVRTEVQRLRLRALGSDWRVRRGAKVALTKSASRLRVEDLALFTDDARITADAELDLARGRILALDVTVPELHVDALRRAGFVPHGPIDGAISARIAKQKETLRADVSVFGRDIGRGRAVARVAIPARPFEPQSWQRLAVDDIRRVRLDLARLDVGEVQRMFGLDPVVRGAASGGVAFRRGHLERGALDLSEAKILGVSEDVAFYISIETPDDAWARVRLTGVLDGQPVLSTKLSLDIAPARLRRDGLEAIAYADFASETHLSAFPLSALEQPRAMSGTVTGTIAVARRGRAIALDVRANAHRARWDVRWPEMDLDIDGRAANGQATLDARLDAGEAGRLELTARGETPKDSADLAAWSALRLDDIAQVELHADNAHLALWADVLEMPELRGVVGADVKLGRAGRVGEATARLDGFSMSETDASIDARAYIDAQPNRTRIEATAFADDRPLLDAEASTPLSLARLTSTSSKAIADLPVEADVKAAKIPMKLIARLLGAKEDVDGDLALVGKLSGALGDPKLEAHVHSANMRIGKSEFEHFAVDFFLNERKVGAEASLRQREGGRLVLDGTVGLGDDDTLLVDMIANDFDLAFLSLVSGAGSATFGGVAGKIDGEVEMSGGKSSPLVAGVMRLVDVRAVLVHPIPPMEDIDGELIFEDQRMRFALRGASGDGRFTFEGQAAGGPKGLEMSSELEIDDVAVAAGPKILETDLTAEIELALAERLDIDVVIRDGNVKLPTKGATERLPVEDLEHVVLVDELQEEPPPRETEGEDTSGSALAYRVQVRTAGQLPIRSPDLNANVVADITVAQSDGAPLTTGFVEVTSGTVNLFGRQWVIDNADVRLAAGRDTEPRLDIRVRHDFPTVTVYVSVSGPPSNPRVRFSSDPGIYSQDQLIGFVLGGTPGAAQEDAPLADQAVGAATGFLLGQVQSRLQDKLPIDTISVELDDSASAEAVSVGKWISSRIFVAYNHRIAPETDENTNAGLVQFRLGRGWMLETTYGDRGNGSADLLYRKRF